MREVSIDHETVGRMMGIGDEHHVLDVGIAMGNMVCVAVDIGVDVVIVAVPMSKAGKWFAPEAGNANARGLVVHGPASSRYGTLTMCYD